MKQEEIISKILKQETIIRTLSRTVLLMSDEIEVLKTQVSDLEEKSELTQQYLEESTGARP